ncbi:MAG TPA: PfkB family carbohydrate kinase, partial [Gammaproteobacteria bacterium]
VFDPGQGMPLFDGDEFRQFVEQATWVAVNDYEWQLLKDRTGWDVAQLMERVEALIVTRGAEGSLIFAGGEELEIPAAHPREIHDPTGCGDAYRAGLLYGIMSQRDWQTVGRIASLMGALKIECHGTQNHSFSRDEFLDRYRENFGEALTE